MDGVRDIYTHNKKGSVFLLHGQNIKTVLIKSFRTIRISLLDILILYISCSVERI
jgi:hypothetical protein